ncbi:MAG: hypothetical protein PPP55_07150 [Halorubrum sp.]
MDAQRREEITGWDARSFSGGFDGLREFADRGISGAATDGTGWLFLLDGRVLGTADVDLDAFADTSGTLYEAPDEALPLLFAMQERGGEKRAQYYTKDTPLSAADRKLSEGGFTGYVELSENVLSGDYYVAYAAGESMPAAYVGNSRRLETGEKAFDLADDEVGIYTVYEVDLDVRELPADTTTETPNTSGSETPSASGTGASNDARDDPSDPATESSAGDDHGSSEPSPAAADAPTEAEGASSGANDTGQNSRDRSGGSRSEEPRADPAAASGRTGAVGDDQSDHLTSGAEMSGDAEAGTNPDTNEHRGSEPTAAEADVRVEQPARERSDHTEHGAGAESARSGATDDPGVHARGSEDVFSEEAEWREAKSIPALDPSETEVRSEQEDRSRNASGRSEPPTNTADGRSRGRGNGESVTTDASTGESSAGDTTPDPRPTRDGTSRTVVSQSAPSGDTSGRVAELESALTELESERDDLEAALEDETERREALEAARDELEAERDRLTDELEALRSEADRLRDRLSEAESQLPDDERTISPGEAREGTNLFIRYDSKGGATLDDVHDGAVGREELRENLRIEHHTSFETDGLTVDGRPYEEFLHDTMEYGFTRWLVEELPFEVGDTGNASALRDLYDALPEVDRAEIGGSVSTVTYEAGEEVREQLAFDLVLRDRMGNPLFVAELNDTRAPTAGATLESLVANGGEVADSNDQFAGAFAVTASFFEPAALEAASDAVGGGLFSRSKRKSFVKLSRKRGYHLCLAESRDGGFHLTVPDL